MSETISILIPCLNEEKYIETCLNSKKLFNSPATLSIEVFILDGGSTDKTRDLVSAFAQKDHRFKLIDNPGKIQSSALNIGLSVSQGDWIMRLDAHASYPVNYLNLCYETAKRTGADNVGGICITLPGGKGYQAQLIQALTTHKFGIGNSGFRTGAKEGVRDTVPFGFFRRDIFEKVGLFDERLVSTQDFEFNRRIKASGRQIYSNPEIESTYYNLKSFLQFLKKQLLKQGPYNTYMWYLAPYSFVPRHSITGFFVAFLLAGLMIAPFSKMFVSFLVLVLSLYFFLAVFSSIQQARRYRYFRHVLFLPFCFFLFHLCLGTGVLIGFLRLLTRTAPVLAKKEPWVGAGRFRAGL
jgi:glycosyltransferase involved in cell wall biosynthesis